MTDAGAAAENVRANPLWHPAGAVAARLVLGGIFLYSGVSKIGHVADLARIINGYRILHLEMVNFPALTLPWLEIIVGAMLLLGLLRRSSALVSCGLYGVFIIAVGLAMARGIESPCGCFSVAAESERIGWQVLVRDVFLGLLSAYLVVHPSRFAEVDALLGSEQPRVSETSPPTADAADDWAPGL
ncbi:MAG: DoxX family membrane protein [Armatimonadota bacterium]|nr:MAG: DoxX family membrane protein [Armatimonadota bacterium]